MPGREVRPIARRVGLKLSSINEVHLYESDEQ